MSGTTLRFVTAALTLTPAGGTVTGAPALLRRPVAPLCAALAELGATARVVGPDAPVHVAGGGLRGGTVTIDVTASSQFASAVLLAAPCAAGATEVRTRGRAALDYVSLTADAMRRMGADVTRSGDGWRVAASGYTATDVTVAADASSVAHLYALAMATAGEVTVTDADAPGQPDARITDVLAAMGGAVTRTGSSVRVRGPARLRAVDVDLTATPDQVTTIACLAALADGTTRISGARVARSHETDRLAALARELAKLGVRVTEHDDGLDVTGGVRHGARLATYDDHRLAMAFASIGARTGGVTVEDPGCVAKTYPGFWSDATRLGLMTEAA